MNNKKCMKNRILLLLFLIFVMISLSFTNMIYAENSTEAEITSGNALMTAYDDSRYKEEIEAYKNYDKGWDGFYKNFIIDIAEVKISFYKGSSLVNTTYVLPTQFQGSSALKIVKPMIDGEKDVVLRNPDGEYLSIGHCKFSDNIPQLSDYGEGDEPFILFNKWDGAKEFADWSKDSVNLVSLISDIGMSEDTIFEGKGVIEWLNSGNSIMMEPVTYYPYTNEEIHCNDKDISKAHALTHSLSVYLDAISAASDDLSTEDRIAIKNGTYSGSNRNVLKWMGSRLFYHCGFLSTKDQQDRKSGFNYGEEVGNERRYLAIGDEYESNNTSNLTEKWKDTLFAVNKELKTIIADNVSEFAGNTVGGVFGEEKTKEVAEDITRKVMDSIETILPTTYLADYGIDLMTGNISAFTDDFIDTSVEAKIKTQLTNAFLGGFKSGFDTILRNANIDENALVKGVSANKYVNDESNKFVKKLIQDIIVNHLLDKMREYKNEVINGLNKALGMIGSSLAKLGAVKYDAKKNAYYIEESIRGVRGHFAYLTYTETTKYSKEWITQSGLEDVINWITGSENPVSKINTDHNKYFMTIPKSTEAKIKEMQQILVTAGVLKDEDPMRYGAALICGGSVVLGDEILIKFHSNLEQLGGTGGIDDDWHLIGKIGSSDYKWKNKSGQVSKIPKTYSDDEVKACQCCDIG